MAAIPNRNIMGKEFILFMRVSFDSEKTGSSRTPCDIASFSFKLTFLQIYLFGKKCLLQPKVYRTV